MANKKKKKNIARSGGESTEQPSSQAKRSGSEKAGSAKRRTGPNWPVLILSMVGAALAGYLTLNSWFGADAAFCGQGSSCDLVQESRWGSFLGLPTAFLGLLTYLALGHVAYRERKPEKQWKNLWLISIVGVGYSLYLTTISYTVLEAFCFYCLISLGLMISIFVTLLFQKPQGIEGFSWPSWAGQTALIPLVIVGGMHLHYSGVFDAAAGPEDPYVKELAIHLKESGALFYGAFW